MALSDAAPIDATSTGATVSPLLMQKGRRVAIVAGLRSPFARQATAYREMSALDLGKMVVNELFVQTGLDPALIQQVVFGQVVPSTDAPNIARELVLGTPMPRSIEAFSVSRACATSFQAVVSVTEAILLGTIDCGLAGGADTASVVPITVSKRLASALLDLSKAKTLQQRLNILSKLKLKDLAPIPIHKRVASRT